MGILREKQPVKHGSNRTFLLHIAVIAVAGLVAAAVVSAPYVTTEVLEAVNSIRGLRAERVRLGFSGVTVEGLSLNFPDKGLSGKLQRVRVGWPAVMGVSRKVSVSSGVLFLPPFDRLLSDEKPGLTEAKVRFDSLDLAFPARGKMITLGGLSGSVLIQNGKLKEADMLIRRTGLGAGTCRFTYSGESDNALTFKADLSSLRPFVGGRAKNLSGKVEFRGTLDPTVPSGGGTVSLSDLSFATPAAEVLGMNLSARVAVHLRKTRLEIRINRGLLRTPAFEHDFARHTASLSAEFQKEDDGLLVNKFLLLAPGWLDADISGFIADSGRVDVRAQVSNIPLPPLLRSETLSVHSGALAKRTYTISGTWPRLSCSVVTSAENLSLEIPSIDLEITGIKAGPLLGKWFITPTSKPASPPAGTITRDIP